MNGTELHVQAVRWARRRVRCAALIMEGEAPDRSNDGAVVRDALYRVALGNGLRLTTDLDHLDPRPVPGWRILVDHAGAVTVGWPRFHPLIEHAPLDLPSGWLGIAAQAGAVRLFVGHGLGLHDHVGDGTEVAASSLEQAAETGALASGMVRILASGHANFTELGVPQPTPAQRSKPLLYRLSAVLDGRAGWSR